MLQQKFVDREKELVFLNKMYYDKAPQFLIVYGRRRVGKTELIQHFIKDKLHIYFLADERGDIFNLVELKKSMAGYLNNPLLEKAEIKDWAELFNEFTKGLENAKNIKAIKSNGKKTIIVIDEFPYLIKSNNAITSIFQKIWDLNLSKKDVMLIILGSSISVMETDVLDYTSPLYGRRTGQWKLEQLKFKYLKEFLDYSFEELVKSYAVLDGIPLYILKFEPNLSFTANLKENLFSKGQFLYEEAEMLLRQEVREPANYFNILKAISFRRNTSGEIINFSGLDKTIVSKYLDTLINLRIIEKEYPITQRVESRNAHYKFMDNYFNFWFRYVYPNKTLIEQDKQDVLLDNIKEDFNIYVSNIFEKICKEFLLDNYLDKDNKYLDKGNKYLNKYNKIHFTFDKIGRWWQKDKEIDIIAKNDKTKEILFAECKWQKKVDAKKIISDLKNKAQEVEWNNSKRIEYYAVFAKSFKDKKNKTKEQNVFLFDLYDLEKRFKEKTR